MDRVAIALGSSLGDRRAHLDYAVRRLRTLLADMSVSAYHETEPVGPFVHTAPQPRFLNAAVVGLSSMTPRQLLDALLAIERERGRERPHVNAPRTLDLDLILFGNAVMDEPGVIVPHPRFRERRFVLAPLAELAPEWREPVTGRTIAELLADIDRHASGN